MESSNIKYLESIVKDISNIEQQLLTLSILNSINKILDLDTYIDTINSLIIKINSNYNSYLINQDEVTFNIIDNDYETLNELLNEAKSIYYKEYPINLLSMLSSHNKKELNIILSTINEYNNNQSSNSLNDDILTLVNKIKPLLDIVYQSSINSSLTNMNKEKKSTTYEQMIYTIRQYVKSNMNDTNVYLLYLKLLSFFYLYIGGVANV